jgi:hypothetical protein
VIGRILARVHVTDEGCWQWCGAQSGGYGQIKYGRSVCLVHRIMYEAVYGPIPAGMIVCHLCDNPGCINPDHLWIGTNADNVADRCRKGRSAFGVRNGRAKLTTAQVAALRAAWAAGERNMSRLARRFNVSPRNVGKIVRYETRVRG